MALAHVGGVMGGEGEAATQRLAELVAARICHDLSGPLSIISTAAELARLEAERGMRDGGEAMALMLEGAHGIAARVKLLRAVFGPAGDGASVADISALTAGLLGGGRASLDVTGLDQASRFEPAVARAILAALMLAGEALPRGGTIRCLGGADDLAVAIEGPSAAWPAGLSAAVAGDDAVAAALAGGSRTLLGPMVVLVTREAGMDVSLLMGPGVPLLRLARAAAA